MRVIGALLGAHALDEEAFVGHGLLCLRSDYVKPKESCRFS